jgi:malate dehydrogenase (oxaloacetate-decarboxylating)(NADP+)
MVSEEQLAKDCLYPPLAEVRDVSAGIAAAIAENEQKKGTLRVPVPPEGFLAHAKSRMHDPFK